MADPTLTNHFMGSNSGIADGSWPASEAFNSTMDFTLQLVPPNETDPGFAQTQCSGSWAGKSYPMSWVSCEASWAKWRFQKSASWNECNFVLEVEVSEVTP